MAQEKKPKKSSAASSNPKKRKADSSYSSNAAKGDDANASSSANKRALRQERQSHRKHADVVAEAKLLWNKLRLKSNSKEQVRELATQLATLIQGKAPEIVLQHDASRVVQAVLQFGTNEERLAVLQELSSGQASSSSSLSELAKNQYAHFMVLKSIKYGVHSPECIKIIVKAFKGHIPKLAVHATGAKVVEAIFQTFPHKSTAALKQEFYGPHFALFAADVVVPPQLTAKDDKTDDDKSASVVVGSGGIPDLAFHLKRSPDKKEVALAFVRNILNRGMDKSLFGFTFFQELFAEYVANASPNDVRDIAPSVVDHSIHLLSSKAGTRVVAACVSYGTAKDRKRIMKSLKGFAKSALLHRDAYLAILRLVQITDDTVSTNKNIFQELLTAAGGSETEKAAAENNKSDEDTNKPTMLELALDDRACKLFLMLLVTNEFKWKKLFDNNELVIMEDTNPVVTVTEGGQKKEVPTSKKDPETRREELMQHLQKPLIEICTNHIQELLFSLSGSALVREVYHSFHPENLVDAIVDLCASELDRSKESKQENSKENTNKKDEEDSDNGPSLFEDRVGHLAVKNLILCDVEIDNSKDQAGLVSAAIFNKLKNRLLEVAGSNRGAFVLSALCKVPSIRDDVVKTMKSKTAKLKKLADESTATAGYEALLKEIEGN